MHDLVFFHTEKTAESIKYSSKITRYDIYCLSHIIAILLSIEKSRPRLCCTFLSREIYQKQWSTVVVKLASTSYCVSHIPIFLSSSKITRILPGVLQPCIEKKHKANILVLQTISLIVRSNIDLMLYALNK